jgi:carbon monoxide dehydrogenase subunit G
LDVPANRVTGIDFETARHLGPRHAGEHLGRTGEVELGQPWEQDKADPGLCDVHCDHPFGCSHQILQVTSRRSKETPSMDMTGERRIPASRESVWLALNNPEVLKAAIPGCESMEKLSDTELKATAAVKIGPIAARFTGKVQLLDLDPPNSYRIEGEGQGGVAGFAKGGAVVKLSQDGAETLLSYDVKAQVGGKIAQLGARLIDATAKQMADAFFNNFSAAVAASAEPGASTAPMAQATLSVFDLIPEEIGGLPIVAWIGILLYLPILYLLLSAYL